MFFHCALGKIKQPYTTLREYGKLISLSQMCWEGNKAKMLTNTQGTIYFNFKTIPVVFLSFIFPCKSYIGFKPAEFLSTSTCQVPSGKI